MATKSIASKQTKAQILSVIAENTGLTKKQVAAVLDSVADLATGHLQKGGSGEFVVPSLGLKLRRVRKPARPARTGINPATQQAIQIPAKDAMDVVRATPLKALKDVVSGA